MCGEHGGRGPKCDGRAGTFVRVCGDPEDARAAACGPLALTGPGRRGRRNAHLLFTSSAQAAPRGGAWLQGWDRNAPLPRLVPSRMEKSQGVWAAAGPGGSRLILEGRQGDTGGPLRALLPTDRPAPRARQHRLVWRAAAAQTEALPLSGCR